MKLEVGQFVRTKDGIIDKILKLNESYVKGVSQKDDFYAYDIDNIIKASYNIIDILEKGDYVNGSKVIDISIIGKDKEKWVWVEQTEDTDNKYGDDYVGYNNEQIKSIVTKEQMEQMAYKVGGVNDNTAKNE